jgi:hypothetical protein
LHRLQTSSSLQERLLVTNLGYAGALLSICLQENPDHALEDPHGIHGQRREPVQFTTPVPEVELPTMQEAGEHEPDEFTTVHRSTRMWTEIIEREHSARVVLPT